MFNIKILNKSIVLAGLIGVCASPSHASPVWLFGGVHCFIACGHPPSLVGPSAAAHFLRKDPYDRITGLDRWSALFTTPLGKCLGINGWRKYHFRVLASGTVVQAVTSWDGLRTLDLAARRVQRPAAELPGQCLLHTRRGSPACVEASGSCPRGGRARAHCRRASLGWSRVFGNSSGTEDRY